MEKSKRAKLRRKTQVFVPNFRDRSEIKSLDESQRRSSSSSGSSLFYSSSCSETTLSSADSEGNNHSVNDFCLYLYRIAKCRALYLKGFVIGSNQTLDLQIFTIFGFFSISPKIIIGAFLLHTCILPVSFELINNDQNQFEMPKL